VGSSSRCHHDTSIIIPVLARYGLHRRACLSSNSIGFAHVIKAMEPFFSAAATLIVLGQIMEVRVYLSLLPLVGHVFSTQ
jgi:hypothetical protein